VIRAVLDTNVWVAGLLTPSGPPARILDLAISGALTPVVSPAILHEYEAVLTRPELNLPVAEVRTALAYLKIPGAHVVHVDPADLPGVCSDPDDDHFLAAALAARAAAVVAHALDAGPPGLEALQPTTEVFEMPEADAVPEADAPLADPEGLTHEVRVLDVSDEPLIAEHPEIPAELALQGFHAVRAHTTDPERSRSLLENTLGFVPIPHGPMQSAAYEVRGDQRGGVYLYDPPPPERGMQGAGTVHHVAWASQTDDHVAWREQVLEAGAQPTPVIDRFYFKSIYFREPGGVLFEIATLGPGFATDEPLEHLGERLSLPPAYEHLRDRLEQVLTPLPDARPARTA